MGLNSDEEGIRALRDLAESEIDTVIPSALPEAAGISKTDCRELMIIAYMRGWSAAHETARRRTRFVCATAFINCKTV